MEGQPTTQPAADGRRLRGERSRARIRRAARDLFRERGFDGATLRAIAERAGMGAISIYRHGATTYPDAPVARRVLTLQDRTIGLIAEILQTGRKRDLAPDTDVLSSARAIFHITSGARISWANGLLTERACRKSIETSVELLFRGIARSEAEGSQR
jgi:AcrR family transcriptional regulator